MDFYLDAIYGCALCFWTFLFNVTKRRFIDWIRRIHPFHDMFIGRKRFDLYIHCFRSKFRFFGNNVRNDRWLKRPNHCLIIWCNEICKWIARFFPLFCRFWYHNSMKLKVESTYSLVNEIDCDVPFTYRSWIKPVRPYLQQITSIYQNWVRNGIGTNPISVCNFYLH